jgi:hypothetical protein
VEQLDPVEVVAVAVDQFMVHLLLQLLEVQTLAEVEGVVLDIRTQLKLQQMAEQVAPGL